MTTIEVFFYLQILDFLTTLMGLRLGGTEMSPFIRWLMHFDPVIALSAVKLLGFGMAGYCLWSNRKQVLRWTNYFFAGLVMWNVYNIYFALTAVR